MDLCLFATIEHDLHRVRRAALAPYFSVADVRRLQPAIQERVDVLLSRINGFRDTDEVLNASCMFAALTNGKVDNAKMTEYNKLTCNLDVVNTYSFARSDHRLGKQPRPQ